MWNGIKQPDVLSRHVKGKDKDMSIHAMEPDYFISSLLKNNLYFVCLHSELLSGGILWEGIVAHPCHIKVYFTY